MLVVYCPAAQTTEVDKQEDASHPATVPDAQSEQNDALATFEYMPGAHEKHAAESPARYFPAGQTKPPVVHDDAPEAEVLPESQRIHAAALEVENFPAGHSKHSLELMFEYIPEAQSVHLMEFKSFGTSIVPYCPATQ